MSIRIAIALVILAVTPAAAQPVATPYLHGNFGDVEIRRGGWGAQLGYYGQYVGVELDVDRHHHFYKDDELDSVPNNCIPGVMGPCIDADTDAWLVMGNVVGFLPRPRTSKWRPYAAIGGGVVHAWIHGARELDSDQTHPVFDLGVGVTYWYRSWIGFRADLRYLHVFVDEARDDGGYHSDYDFGRLSLGVTFAIPKR